MAVSMQSAIEIQTQQWENSYTKMFADMQTKLSVATSTIHDQCSRSAG